MLFREMREKYQYFWEKLRPHRLELFFITLILFFEIWLNVLIPIPAKKLLNDILPAKPEAPYHLKIFGFDFGEQNVGQALLLVAVMAISVGIFSVVVAWVEQFWLSEVTFRLQQVLRQDLFRRLFSRQQGYLDAKRKVDLVGRVSGDVDNLEIFLQNGYPAFTRDLPMILTLVTLMFTINARLTFLFALILVAYYFVGDFFTARNRAASRELRRTTVSFEEDTYESMSSMAIAKSLRGERKLFGNLMEKVLALTVTSRRQRDYTLGLETAIGAMNFTVRGTMYFLGGWAIFRKEVGLGDLFQMFSYMQIIERHINNLNKFFTKFPKAHASLERVLEMERELRGFAETSGSARIEPASRLRAARAALEFAGVHFHYDETKPLFRAFDLALAPGQLIAIVGMSGAGKSSFSRLLNRLNDPVAGELRLGGVRLPELELDHLRRLVRVLSQDTFLISGSVRENLLVGSDEARADSALWAALRAVNGEEFVRALPQCLETRIGEGGHPLSGGQAKRIHLARAFLDDGSELLLIDEPTSGLDTHSAEIVMESIAGLRAGKALVFWVTHRMQEVRRADAVLFFSPKHNPVFSTHDHLFAASPAYRALMQSEDAPPPAEASKSFGAGATREVELSPL